MLFSYMWFCCPRRQGLSSCLLLYCSLVSNSVPVKEHVCDAGPFNLSSKKQLLNNKYLGRCLVLFSFVNNAVTFFGLCDSSGLVKVIDQHN
jgi:hypothetical protein